MSVHDEDNTGQTGTTRHEEEIYQHIVLDFPNVLIIIADKLGHITKLWAGSSVAQITGYATEELETDLTLWLNIIHPEDRERILDVFKRQIIGEPRHEEYRIFSKDGQMHWLRYTIVAAGRPQKNESRLMGCITDITDLRITLNQAARFRQLADETPNAVTIRDLSGRLVYCNASAAELYGFKSVEQMLGTTFADVLDPVFNKEFQEKIFPQIRRGRWSGEVTLKRKDGETVHVKANSNLIMSENKEPVALYSILTDITEIKQAEKALRESKEKFRNLVEQINDWVWKVDENIVYTYSSPRVRDLLGYEPEEILGKTPFDFMPPEEAKRLKEIDIHIDRNAPLPQLENKLIRKDGTEVIAQISGLPIIDEDGRFRGYRGVARDITEQSRLRREVDEALAQYRAVVENSPSGIYIVQNERLVFVNKAIANMMGYEPEEVLGHKIWEYVHPDDIPWLKNYYKLRLSGKKVPTKYGARGISRSGEVRYFDYRVTLIRYQGAPAILLNAVDITEHKHAEEILQQSEEQLRAVRDSLPALLAVIDRNGNIINVNEAWEKCARENGDEDLRYTGVGVNYLDVCRQVKAPDSDREEAQQAIRGLQSVLECKTSEFEMEYRCPRPNELRHYFMRAAPLRMGQGGAVIAHIDITDRKRAEIAVKESEERLRTIVENVNVLIFRMSPDFKAVMLAGNTEKMIGYTTQELMERSDLWSGGIRPDDRDRLYNELSKAASTGSNISTEFRIVTASGESRWFRAQVKPSYDEYGRFQYYDGVMLDITGRKKAEEALTASEEKFRSLVEQINDWVWEVDENIIYTYVSPRTYDLLGCKPEEVIGRSPFDLMTPEEAKRVADAVGPFITSHEPFTLIENTMQRCDKGEVIVETSGMPIFDRRGIFRGYRGVDRDITERKAAEQAVRESQERLRTVVENADATIFRIDKDMKLLALGGSVEKMLERSVDELMENPSMWKEVVYPDDRDKAQELMALTEETRAPQAMEFRVVRASGEVRWIRGHLTPIFNERGKLMYFDGVSLDVTERKQVEEVLRESEERYRSLAESVNAIIFRMAPDGELLTLAGRVQEITGYSAEELMPGKGIARKNIYFKDRERAMSEFAHILSEGVAGIIEFRIMKPSGEIRWMRNSITPQFDDQGNIICIDGVGIDITERIEAQEREAQHTARIKMLTEVSQEFASSLNFQDILEVAARRIGNILNCIGGAVTIDPVTGQLTNISIYSGDKKIMTGLEDAIRDWGFTVETAFGEEGISPKMVADLRQLSDAAAEFADMADLGPAIIGPVYAGDELLCVLFATDAVGREFDEEDFWFVTEVASHASAALANAILYRRQTRIAETLQRSLISERPIVPTMDVATLYLPASGEAKIGGDFFDIIHFGESRVGIVIGDVSGKGVEAAIHTAEAKYMLRGFAYKIQDPKQVIETLNDALCTYTAEETFITLVYILADIQNHTLTYVNAGHEVPLVLCRDEETIKELKPGGPMLGVVSGQVYTSRTMKFAPDDSLICYTDGITDVRRDGERFGFERLSNAIASASVISSQELMDYIMGVVKSFSETGQTDDQVVVVVRPRE